MKEENLAVGPEKRRLKRQKENQEEHHIETKKEECFKKEEVANCVICS